MQNNFFKTSPIEYDEYISHGLYSINPVLSSLQEVVLVYLKELAFYLSRLKDLGIKNNRIKEDYINIFSTIIINAQYSQETFHEIISKLYSYLVEAKTLYVEYCENNNLKAETLKAYFKHKKHLNITDAIRRGEKYYLKKINSYSPEKKNLFDLMLFLSKSMCIRILQTKSFNKDHEDAYYAMLSLLDTMTFNESDFDKIKNKIQEFIGHYYTLVKNLHYAQEEAYGQRDTVYISFNPRPGKAILISGIDLTLLEKVLKATVNRGVNVYTHGIEMLMGHTLEKLKAYPNLAGHFGGSSDNCMVAFSSFPGAILTTKMLYQQIEYLRRGRLFTTDIIAPFGVTKIENDDFEPLIQAALKSKGFRKKYPPKSLRVGFSDELMTQRVNIVLEKMAKDEIKHLYIVGLLNEIGKDNEYFKRFMDLVPKDSHILSLAYDREEENIEHVNSFFDYLFIYKLFHRMSDVIPLNKIKMSVFVTKCDQYTVANLINFTNMGIKDIYMCECPPTLINPSLLETIMKVFDIKKLSSPEIDLKKTMEVTY